MSRKKINYSLRPAKNIERKMLCETFRYLSEFEVIENYKYIGFGSYYFSDFSLFHRELNFSSMYSIERDTGRTKRYETNNPFRCIEIIFGESNEHLPRFDWKESSIVWLDYTDSLNTSILADIETFCTRATPGSMLAISTNAEPGVEISLDEDGRELGRLDRLKKAIGENRIPSKIKVLQESDKTDEVELSEKHFPSWGTARVFREVIHSTITTSLIRRNGDLSETAQINYQQLFNFHYADDAMMLTVGGIIYENSQQHIFDKCNFSKRLNFIRSDLVPYEIEVPCLTYREIRTLDSQLPIPPGEDNKKFLKKMKKLLPGVPEKDILIYAEVYRYFPTFAEANI